MRSTHTETRHDWPFAAGSLLGVFAYGANYAAMLLFLAIDGATWEEGWNTLHESSPMLKFTGQILYNAHFVGTRYTGDGGSVTIRNHVTDASIRENLTSTVPQIGYHVVPIIVLVAAGYLLYRHTDQPDSRIRTARIGLGIVPGYLFLSIAGILLFTLNGFFVGSRPNPLPAILVTGIGYPVLWGVTGVMIGDELHSE